MAGVSPSSRRAWIEMMIAVNSRLLKTVALLAEGVDRNTSINDAGQETARVALLAEGVDRNVKTTGQFIRFTSRPPRGGRG